MAYRDNVQALADKRSIPNPLEEKDINVGGLRFWTDDGPVTIMGTDMNRGGRLFFQEEAENTPRITESIPGTLEIDNRFRERAAAFFAEVWDDKPGTGTHPILDAIRASRQVDLYWK